MQILNLEKLKGFSDDSFIKKELAVTDNFKLLLICFEPGQAVPPCVMSRSTAFYIVEGRGRVIEDGEETAMSAGMVIIVEAGLERQIKAETRLVVLAMQYC